MSIWLPHLCSYCTEAYLSVPCVFPHSVSEPWCLVLQLYKGGLIQHCVPLPVGAQLTLVFVEVHCSCSALLLQFVKIHSCFLRFHFKSSETHTSTSLSPNETKFIHNPKSQSVIVAIVLKSQRPVDPPLDLLLLLHIL